MNGLRVYIIPISADTSCSQDVFYSRRADGPYYSWRYEEALGRWRSSRVLPSVLARKTLCVASWKVVPPALRASLDEHYLE